MSDEPGPTETYRVVCWSCHAEFDALAARWCDCVTGERTRVCAACGRCFCKAPRSFKQAFWSGAPRALWDEKLSLRYHPVALVPNLAPGEVKRPLILLTEDEDDIARIAVEVLASLGYGWVRAKDGVEGLALAKEYRPDLVLTDALMPRMDGREFCRRLKGDPELKGIPVVVMTSLYTSQKYRSEALGFGADEYLSKPLEHDQIAAVMGRFIPPPAKS
ncbi:MAG: response regulator [Thermoanaerobaculia bacterium]